MDKHEEKFSIIYDEYIEKIYRFVYLKVNSKETAEDITSKVFVKGWESYKNQPEIENIGAFLYKIARNSVIDHYRQTDKNKIISTDYIAKLPDIKADSHERAIINQEFEQVKLAIKGLKKDYQDVLIWHYLDDVSIGQIAKILEKPEGTIRVMMHRGLRALKESLIQEV